MGYQSEEHSLSGTIRGSHGQPLAHQRIEVVAHGALWDSLLGTCYTGSQGEFNFPYTVQTRPLLKQQTLLLRVFEERLPSTQDPSQRCLERQVACLELEKPLALHHWTQPPLRLSSYDCIESLPILRRHVPSLRSYTNERLKARLYPLDLEALDLEDQELQLSGNEYVGNSPCTRDLLALHPCSAQVRQIDEERCEARLESFSAHIEIATAELYQGRVECVTLHPVRGKPLSASPKDPKFKQLVYLFNSALMRHTLFQGYLIQTILPCAQAAWASRTCLRSSPLRHLLGPHLEHCLLMPGPQGEPPPALAILPQLGFDAPQVRSHMGKALSQKWELDLPESDRAAGEMKKLIESSVALFFEDYAEEIADEWNEIQEFSIALKTHGCILFDAEIAPGSPENICRLQAFCARTLYLAIWQHWQLSRCLGNYGGHVGMGLWSLQGAPNESAQAHAVLQQVAYAGDLIKSQGDALLSNPNGEVYDGLIEALREATSAFEALGYTEEELAQIPVGPRV
jgi:hypothetical protein